MLSKDFYTPPLRFATQNIEEVARSDGGVKNTLSESNRGGLEYKQAPDNCGSPSGFIPLAAKKNKRIESIIMP